MRSETMPNCISVFLLLVVSVGLPMCVESLMDPLPVWLTWWWLLCHSSQSSPCKDGISVKQRVGKTPFPCGKVCGPIMTFNNNFKKYFLWNKRGELYPSYLWIFLPSKGASGVLSLIKFQWALPILLWSASLLMHSLSHWKGHKIFGILAVKHWRVVTVNLSCLPGVVGSMFLGHSG